MRAGLAIAPPWPPTHPPTPAAPARRLQTAATWTRTTATPRSTGPPCAFSCPRWAPRSRCRRLTRSGAGRRHSRATRCGRRRSRRWRQRRRQRQQRGSLSRLGRSADSASLLPAMLRLFSAHSYVITSVTLCAGKKLLKSCTVPGYLPVALADPGRCHPQRTSHSLPRQAPPKSSCCCIRGGLVPIPCQDLPFNPC